MKRVITTFSLTLIFCTIFYSCKKDPLFIPGNTAPNPNNVPTVLIENYVNRIFIDLIGREPLNPEMEFYVTFLREQELNLEARAAIITQLQTDTSWVEGDTSYKRAYYQRFYDMAKARVIEGVGDADIRQEIGILSRTFEIDSLNGDTIPPGNFISSGRAALEIEKLEKVLASKIEYMNGEIGPDEIFRRMCNNRVYDQINMNTFNIINATFDELFYRFPTQAEFSVAWEMMENNQSKNLLGKNGQNRGDYIEILTTSREFYEGMITWAFLNLMARFPSTAEVKELMNEYFIKRDFQKVQMKIMITNEYANFN